MTTAATRSTIGDPFDKLLVVHNASPHRLAVETCLGSSAAWRILLDGERAHLATRERGGGASRIDPRVEQRLRRLDVADAGEQRLIEQHGLHGAHSALERREQRVGVDPVDERIGPEGAPGREVVLGDREGAEPPRIDVAQAAPRAALARVEAQPLEAQRRVVRGEQPLAGHPEVRERPPLVEDQAQPLAAAIHRAHAPAGERTLDGAGAALDDARVVHLRGDDVRAAERALEDAARELDLGQLGHGRSLPRFACRGPCALASGA